MTTLRPFIVGVPRSGTTLLRMMLDTHPEFAIPAETHFLKAVPRLANLDDARERFLQTVVGTERWRDFPITAQALAKALGQAPLRVSDCVRRFYELYAAGRGKPRWGDKTPIYLAMMSDLSALLPESAFIHMIRDGRDAAVSGRSVWFGAGNDMSAHANLWIERIRQGRRQAETLPHYIEVRYERLVLDPAPELQRVCTFLGVAYSERMLDYPRAAADRLTELQAYGEVPARVRRDMHALTQHDPDASRIGRWRAEMTADERAEYEAIASPLLRELGYEA